MNAWTQLRSDGRAEQPSLDPSFFDAARGAILPCRAKMRTPNSQDEMIHQTSVLDFAAGERERIESA